MEHIHRSNPNSISFGHWRIQFGWKLWLMPSAALRFMESIKYGLRRSSFTLKLIFTV